MLLDEVTVVDDPLLNPLVLKTLLEAALLADIPVRALFLDSSGLVFYNKKFSKFQ